jgi:hypothetical protein
MYTPWGWATDDAPQALSHLSRFASVTCLNGHVHQIMNKVEGKVSFHTAAPMAYPLPLPGHGPAPQPVVLPPSHLNEALGVRDVHYVARQQELDVHNERLA